MIARFALTVDGRLALQHALRVDVAPIWEATCTSVVPALALGLEVGSEAANAALRSVDAMATALLRRDPTLGNPVSVAELCDQVIAKALGMPPGPVTSAEIRAFALAMHCGVDSKAELSQIAAGFRSARSAMTPEPQLKVLAAGFVRKQLGVMPTTKAAMVKALQRRWMSQHDQADEAHRVTAAWATPLRPSPLASETAVRSAMSPAPGAAEDKLLAAVRAAIPVIGAAGRYGKENVFVSALWQHLVRERRADLSLDGFKRWLIAANREQQVDLARADLVDAMNDRLVEDSAIEDLGATFHFVVDRGQISSEQVTRA